MQKATPLPTLTAPSARWRAGKNSFPPRPPFLFARSPWGRAGKNFWNYFVA